MNYEEWWEDFVAEHEEWKYADSAALRRAAFQAGAASRDAEIAELKDALGYDWDKYKASQMALRECMQMVVEQDAEIAELVAALKPFGAIDLVESRLPAEFAMLILRARAAIAAAKTQGYSEQWTERKPPTWRMPKATALGPTA